MQRLRPTQNSGTASDIQTQPSGEFFLLEVQGERRMMRADMPAVCQAAQRWAELAQLAPGEPVFRAVDQRQIIGKERLTDGSVARIVKNRVHKLARLRGKSKTEADELVALFSGHSLRAGYATSAAAHDMPGCRIEQHTRHKSAQVVAGYIREADKWTKSGLKGVGF